MTYDDKLIELDSLDRWKEDRCQKPWEMLENFTDFLIEVEDKKYPCHKLILAVHSDYFSGLLLSGMREVSEGKITFKGFKKDSFDVVFAYIYQGKLRPNLSDEVLAQIFQVANMLQISDLELEIVSCLLSRVNPHNCLEKRSLLE